MGTERLVGGASKISTRMAKLVQQRRAKEMPKLPFLPTANYFFGQGSSISDFITLSKISIHLSRVMVPRECHISLTASRMIAPAL